MITGFVGLGNMGTTVANRIAMNGYPVLGWDYNRSVVDEISSRRTNTAYLPGITLNERLAATANLAEVFRTAGTVFIALPSVFLRSTLTPFAGRAVPGTVMVNLAKGIEKDTGRTSFQILADLFPDARRVMLSGPSIANEIARGMPAAVVLAGPSPEILAGVSRLLDSADFATVHSDDAIGTELGGILKNMYAIGLGIFDGCGVSSINFRSVYLTRALREMSEAGMRLGGRRETFYDIAGLGDLFATSLSEHSHNRRMGELLAHGSPVEEIRRKMGVLPEGCNTLGAVLPLAEKLGCSLPVAEGIGRVIRGEMSTSEFISSVLRPEGGLR